MQIKENIKLSDYNTFKIGGDAKFFCEVSNENDLKEALDFCEKKSVPFFVLGGGSNLLISDNGFPGLVIKIEIKGKKIVSEDSSSAVVEIGAGENWDETVKYFLENNLFGVENLSGIPGTVGASAVQNIGAYGVEVSSMIASVEGIDVNSLEKFLIKKEDCLFGYRGSLFKKNKNLIITKVYFQLNKHFLPTVEYADLKKAFADKKEITVVDIRGEVLKVREKKLPDLNIFGTAGSFFKNPVISEEKYLEIAKKYPDLPKYGAENGTVKISLGYVLDKICGFKGYREGDAGFYEKQALVLVNYGNSKSSDILKIAELAKNKVKEKIGIDIEWEVEEV